MGSRAVSAQMCRREVVSLRALGLGDFLTGVPALRALAAAFPDHRHVLAAPRRLAPLARLTGAVDAVVDTPGLTSLDPSLARPALAIDLHGRGPASHRLVAALQPSRLVTFTDPATPEFSTGPRWDAEEHEMTRWCRLLAEHGIAADPGRFELPRPPAAPAWAHGATIVHPGAAFPARRWPAERFAVVAATEVAAGLSVVITAGPGERALAETVAARAATKVAAFGGPPPGSLRVASPDDLEALASLIAVAGRVVCGDTGIAHLATALCTPSVVLFGPVSPAHRGPPPERPHHVALWAGRHGDPHARRVDPGLLEIGVADVVIALARLPARRSPATAAMT